MATHAMLLNSPVAFDVTYSDPGRGGDGEVHLTFIDADGARAYVTMPSFHRPGTQSASDLVNELGKALTTAASVEAQYTEEAEADIEIQRGTAPL